MARTNLPSYPHSACAQAGNNVEVVCARPATAAFALGRFGDVDVDAGPGAGGIWSLRSTASRGRESVVQIDYVNFLTCNVGKKSTRRNSM